MATSSLDRTLSAKWAEACRWEADAIEAYVSVKAVRPDLSQKKTINLLRRIADHLATAPPPVKKKSTIKRIFWFLK